MRRNTWGLILQFSAVIVLFGGVILLLLSIESTGNTNLGILGLSAYYLLIPAFFIFFVLFSLGTIICLLADIEWNTRKQRKYFESLKHNNLSNFSANYDKEEVVKTKAKTKVVADNKQEEFMETKTETIVEKDNQDEAQRTKSKGKAEKILYIVSAVIFVICIVVIIYSLFIR